MRGGGEDGKKMGGKKIKPVVIDEGAVAGVVGGIDVDAFDLAGERGAEGAQGVEVVALDDQVVEGGVPGVEIGRGIEGDEVVVEGAVVFDGVAFPDQPEFFPVANQAVIDTPPQRARHCSGVSMTAGLIRPETHGHNKPALQKNIPEIEESPTACGDRRHAIRRLPRRERLRIWLRRGVRGSSERYFLHGMSFVATTKSASCVARGTP